MGCCPSLCSSCWCFFHHPWFCQQFLAHLHGSHNLPGLFLKILFIFNWESLLIVYKSCFSITFAWTMSLFYMSWIEGDLFIQPTEKHFLYISHAFLFCLEVEKWLLLRRTDLMNCFFLWLGLHHSFLFLKDHRQPSLVQKAGYNAFKHCFRLYLQLSVSLIKQVFC